MGIKEHVSNQLRASMQERFDEQTDDFGLFFGARGSDFPQFQTKLLQCTQIVKRVTSHEDG